MPKAKKAPAPPIQPVTPSPPPPQLVAALAPLPKSDLPVMYDQLEIVEYSIASPKGPLSVDRQKLLLGWESEEEFKVRKMTEVPGSKPEQWLFGDNYHCKNVAGNKVRANNNAHNRPFDMGWCEALVHTVLYGQWAGPHTIPGETVNGETVRISRYGRVMSGQHQMTACILADEWLQRDRELLGLDAVNLKYPAWAKHNHPFLETIVITGMSEDPRVLMTVDYVKPRTAADVFYTSEVFKSCTPPERKELCRMLATATDLLWTRTDARGYRTHPEIVGFLERHKRLLKFVEHLYSENSPDAGRRISKLRLSPGQCAALTFIMGSSGPSTNGDVYRNGDPPTEAQLDWSYQDRAEEFWVMLGSSKDFSSVRTALTRLVDSTTSGDNNQGLGGRGPEKLAILAKAWEAYKDHPDSAGAPFSNDDLAMDGALCLSYSDLDDKGNKLPNGEIKLLDVADFYGIDCPESVSKAKKDTAPMPPPPSREEIEQATAEARKRRQTAKK